MSKQDKTLVMVTVVFWAIMFMILMAARAAEARVALNEPAAYSVGSDGCSMYVDGCAFANQMSGVSTRDADVERSYYLSIKDGAAMGIDAFGLDMTANTAHSTWLLARLSAAMKKYNGENATAKKCVFVSYRAAGGEALSMFNAADSNNSSDSPYCAVEGKPVVGVKTAAAAVDPLPTLAGKGPFVVLGTMGNAADGVPTKAVVDTWKASGASKVLSYPDASVDMNLSATAKATATAAGATFAYGIPSTWARQCGGSECKGPAAAGYTFRDGRGFLAATAALQASLKDPAASVVFPFAFPGRYDEDVSWESAKVCDANDTVAKSGFTCSALPAHLRGTIPTGNAGLSFSNKSFSKAGFTALGQWWAQKFKATADPAAKPFLAWSYREHPLPLSGAGMGICPTAADTALDAKSLSGGGADAIYLTSYSADQVRVRASIGSTVLGTYTLPARQLDLETDARQISIPLGSNRGRPKFEVLDSAGNVIASREGDVTYTDTPTQRNGAVGRNVSTYADSMPIPVGAAAAKASVVKVSADRAEGNAGTSVSTFRVTLDKPAPANSTVDWAVSSTAADVNDFFQMEDVTVSADPDCNAPPPPPAAALGFTKLDFCDGFKFDSIARGPDAAGRRIGGQKKWTIERSAVFGGTGVNPASDFIHLPATGEMQFKLTANLYQSAIQSVNGKQAPTNGYWIESPVGWYVEIKVKMTKQASTSQFAFWSMDMCHWSGGPNKCSTLSPTNAYLEPDWLEYPFGQTAIHRHKEGDTSYHQQCYNSQGGGVFSLPVGTYKTHGVAVVKATNDVRRFVNNTRYDPTLSPTSRCSNMEPWAQLWNGGKYPLLLGGRPGDEFIVDYIRVWKKP